MRTGFGGEKVVINGGAFVIPVLHEMTPVNMNVMRIEVRRGQTHRADHPRTACASTSSPSSSCASAPAAKRWRSPRRRSAAAPCSRKASATCSRASSPRAMRTVAAEMTLEEMHEQRGDYGAAVRELGRGRRSPPTGWSWKASRIVDVDQTSLEYLRSVQRLRRRGPDAADRDDRDAPQDAQPDRAATMVEIRNQNLESERRVLEIDRESEYARLEQEREVEIRRAVQRAELARERALREQEAEQAQIVAARGDREDAHRAGAHARRDAHRQRGGDPAARDRPPPRRSTRPRSRAARRPSASRSRSALASRTRASSASARRGAGDRAQRGARDRRAGARRSRLPRRRSR